jgi:hypothetical protein
MGYTHAREKQMLNERRLQVEALKRIELALKGKSWLWLSEQTGVPQSTLQTQKNVSGDHPRFSLETLASIAQTLKRPISYFLPSLDMDGQVSEWALPVAESAFSQIAEIVDWARSITPDDFERAKEVGNLAASLPASPPGSEVPQMYRQCSSRHKRDEVSKNGE